jgi:hypothetical protein
VGSGHAATASHGPYPGMRHVLSTGWSTSGHPMVRAAARGVREGVSGMGSGTGLPSDASLRREDGGQSLHRFWAPGR